MSTWDAITAESAKRANEQLRRQNESIRQQAANDILSEIRDILKAMLDAHHADSIRYREQAAHNADIARGLVDQITAREDEILILMSEITQLRNKVKAYEKYYTDGI